MRRNRTAYFLIISFALLSLVFYKLLPQQKDSPKKENSKVQIKSEKESKTELKKEKQNDNNTLNPNYALEK